MNLRLHRSPEPGTDPAIEEPEPDSEEIEDPEHPLDPGPAEDPDRHPARGDSYPSQDSKT